MDAFSGLTGRSTAQRFNPEAVLKFTNLDPRVQQHLTRVYMTLLAAICVAGVGVVADVYLHVGGMLAMVVAFGSLMWLAFTPPSLDYSNQNKRLAIFGLFALAQGAALGPLAGLALAISPGIILTTLLSTAAVFVSFTLSALCTQRRSYLFLGGWLGSAVTGLMALRIGGWLFGSGVADFAFAAELYVGLLVFAGYVLFDTQLVVERASAGDFDVVQHSLDLFIDFLAIAVRIALILIRNAEDKQRKEREREGRTRSSARRAPPTRRS